MPTQILFFCLLLLTAPMTYARGPAVEDFVGIEVEQVPDTQGAQLLYNLEQDLNLIAQAEMSPEQVTTRSQARPWSTSAIFSLIILLGLPLVAWSFAMNHFRKIAQAESAANVEILENYRKQKLGSQESAEAEQERKVS